MSENKKSSSEAQKISSKYQSYGMFGGLGVGLIAGVLISGPNFKVWPLTSIILVILGCTLGAGMLGYIAVPIAIGSTAKGCGTGSGFFDIGHGSDSGHHTGCGGDASHGGDGGGGGGGHGDS